MPVQGGGGAPPFAVTGAGCTGQSEPLHPGCDAPPSARAAQSVASPLPAKYPSSAHCFKRLQNRAPPFLCLDPLKLNSLGQKFCSLKFGAGQKKEHLEKKLPRLTPVRGQGQGKEETIGRN